MIQSDQRFFSISMPRLYDSLSRHSKSISVSYPNPFSWKTKFQFIESYRCCYRLTLLCFVSSTISEWGNHLVNGIHVPKSLDVIVTFFSLFDLFRVSAISCNFPSRLLLRIILRTFSDILRRSRDLVWTWSLNHWKIVFVDREILRYQHLSKLILSSGNVFPISPLIKKCFHHLCEDNEWKEASMELR